MKHAIAIAVYAGSAAWCCVLAVGGAHHVVDMHVYRMGGAAVLHGGDLYALRYYGLPFTYPPFSALLFTGFAAVPFDVAVGLLTAASAAAFPVLLRLAAAVPWPTALVAAAAGIWLEPCRTTLGYGQVDLILALVVAADFTLPERTGWQGALTGMAAGIKLTPLIFLGYLALTRRYQACATGLVMFAATIAAGFAVLPHSSAWYWNGTFLRPDHVSPAQDPENQSLLGVLARVLHHSTVTAVWVPAAVAVFAVGMWLAVRAQTRAAAFGWCALTGLLVSPISWTHHWVLAIPGLLAAAVWAYRRRSALTGLGLLAVCWAGWSRLARRVPAGGWLHLSAAHLLDSTVYVLAGLIALAAGLIVRVQRPRQRAQPGRCGTSSGTPAPQRQTPGSAGPGS